MTKLNDMQLVLLSAAAARDGGSVLPLTETLTDAGDRATKAITALIKRKYAEERETSDAASVHRTDGDIRYGVFITEAGMAAIDAGPADKVPEPAPAAPKRPRETKSAAVIALLRREEGATLAELIEATGWLPHTTRAALTGLRKKGHAVERGKRGDETFYRITAVA